MPTVQPSWRAWATIWSVVCLAFGRRIFGIASISSTVSKSFMPIGIERRRRYWLRPFTIASQSNLSVVMASSLVEQQVVERGGVQLAARTAGVLRDGAHEGPAERAVEGLRRIALP